MSKIVKTINVAKYDPLRPVDWRWQRALSLAEQEPFPGRCTAQDDEFIRGARAYKIRLNQGREDKARQQYPAIWLAHQFSLNTAQNKDNDRLLLESRLLAGQADDAVAERMGWHRQAVAWYEAIFFNVRDRLKAKDYILKQILWPAIPTFDKGDDYGSREATLRGVGYFGGEAVLEHFLDLFTRGVPSDLKKEGGFKAWLDDQWETNLKRKCASASTTFPINDFTLGRLFEVNASLLAAQRAAGDTEASRGKYESNLKVVVEAMAFNVKQDAEHNQQLRDLTGHAELTAAEQLSLAAGELPNVDEYVEFQIPPPYPQNEEPQK